MISLVGISHKTAPLAVRECFALPEKGAEGLLAALPGEALLLVTCNRTELYGTVPAQDLRAALVAAAGAPGETPLFVLHGHEAVQHLLAVAAGLDSMVLGEPQILGQVREALLRAQRIGRIGPILDRLGRQALIAGRRVRRETPLGLGRPSIPKLATQVAREALGGWTHAKMLLIGAGKVGGLTARALRAADVDTVVVTSRTLPLAEALAAEIGALAAPFEALDRLLTEADIVISCTDSPEVVLGSQRVQRATEERAGRPLVIIDLAVPRDVDPEVRLVPGLRLFDLDDLWAAGRAEVDTGAVARAEAIVEEEAGAFLTWLAGRQAVPTIRALREQAEAILEAELARTPGDQEHLRAFGRRLFNKLLHHPTVRLRDRAASHGSAYLDVACDLFALDGQDADG